MHETKWYKTKKDTFTHTNVNRLDAAWIISLELLLIPVSLPSTVSTCMFHVWNVIISMVCFVFKNRCDCDWQAVMTALDTYHWFGADFVLLNSDLGSVCNASASVLGSISTGTDAGDENDKIVVFESRMVKKIFALMLSGGKLQQMSSWTQPAGLQQWLDKPVWSTTVPLQCRRCWTLLIWSYCNCRVTLTLVMLTWTRENHGCNLRGRPRRTI